MKKLIWKHFLWGISIFIGFFSILLISNYIISPNDFIDISIIYMFLVFFIMSIIYSALFTILDYFTIFKSRIKDLENKKEVL